ncbi:MAG TPA: hypothetical protein VHI77_06415 [Solirubrobacterales bacterium]|jgi:hypothetical protein|nr:hypothetical protein [Solirubrobacterales bacterium]
MGSPGRTCAVCGRTILAGEQVRGYVSDAGPRGVCELCVARAERLGWLSEEEAERKNGGAAAGSRRPRRGFASLLRRRAASDEPGEDRGLLRRRSGERSEPVPEADVGGEEPAPEPAGNGPDPAAPGRRPQGPPPDLFQPSLFERAVARFNASDAGRTVVGLTRTLGAPWVSVGASAGAPSEMRITVAWELSWYQWGVDLGDELRPVFQIDKGQEIDQLDAAARQWNASTDEEGQIVGAAPGHAPAGAGTVPR